MITLSRESFKRMIGVFNDGELIKQVQFLKEYSFFSTLTNSKLMSILHSTEMKIFEAKNVIYNKNEEAKYIYLI